MNQDSKALCYLPSSSAGNTRGMCDLVSLGALGKRLQQTRSQHRQEKLKRNLNKHVHVKIRQRFRRRNLLAEDVGTVPVLLANKSILSSLKWLDNSWDIPRAPSSEQITSTLDAKTLTELLQVAVQYSTLRAQR